MSMQFSPQEFHPTVANLATKKRPDLHPASCDFKRKQSCYSNLKYLDASVGETTWGLLWLAAVV